MTNIETLCQKAKRASRKLAHSTSEEKNEVLRNIAGGLKVEREGILLANQQDIDLAKEAGLSEAMIDRLSLQGDRLEGILQDLGSVIHLDDPIGQVIGTETLDSQLEVSKVRTPLGVIGVIYESRPNVTIDIAALAIKSGNAAVIRGGKETMNSNRALVKLVRKALKDCSIDSDCFMFVDDHRRECVHELLQCYESVDMIIPRGGASLHQYCREHSKIPVITGGIGICHIFVDDSADLDRALDVVHNAKTQRPSVCNALDTLLVHESVAETFIPQVVRKLGKDGVSFKGDDVVRQLCKEENISPAVEDDWDTEWLSLILGIKIVSGLDEAIEHIAEHSSGHSDCILTETEAHCDKFLKYVDSAAVYVNASTRFTDGSQMGLGAEIAISTQKLHARGPMALSELSTYKWVIKGNYQVRTQ
ncbi:MAG: glutamate-5-semialdehyde dehydrogenase [Chlamydiota bacterium]